MKLKTYFLIIFLFIFSGLLSSCTTTRTYWEYEAEALYYSLPQDWDCQKRVAYLSQKLHNDRKVHYIIHGTYKGHPHRWIELEDGTILDPTILWPVRGLYKKSIGSKDWMK